MADAEGVVFAFLASRKWSEAVFLLDRGDPVATTGQDLVWVALVADIPDQTIIWRIKQVVQGDGQLNHAQACAEMTARTGHRLDQVITNLACDFAELMLGEWRVNRLRRNLRFD